MKSWKTPTLEQVIKAVALLGRPGQRRYFFDRLENPLWINLLKEKEFFDSPPSVVKDEAGRTSSFPPWPESRYLSRMATKAPHTVLEVILQIPETDNVGVHEDFIDAALAMPADLAAKLVTKAKQRIELPHPLFLPQKLGKLIEYLAKGGQGEAALDLAGSLLEVQPDPKAADKMFEDSSYPLPPEPRARFDVWEYKEILEKNIPALVTTTGKKALNLLCDLLDSAIRLSQRDEKAGGAEDFSIIWRPAIEDHDHNHPHELKDLLISAVRDTAELIAAADPSQIATLVIFLEGQRWRVFHRMALHLLRVSRQADFILISERLINRSLFDEWGLWHEYILLLQERFTQLSPKDQQTILNWIETGPSLAEERERVEKLFGQTPSPKELERAAAHWRLRCLAPLREVLPPEWKQRYKEWTTELGEPEHPELVVHVEGGTWGPTSPKSADELRLMEVGEIIAFLKNWQWSGDRLLSPEGLGRELTALVASDPGRFAEHAVRFQELDPTYVRAFLSGLRDAAKANLAFPWLPVLQLCQWVVAQPREISDRKSQYADLDPGWVWTRKTIANLLVGGFESAPMIPFELRSAAWAVLKPLTDDPEPNQEHEAHYGARPFSGKRKTKNTEPAQEQMARYEGSNMDPATLSINTTRGEAMHATVRYALWVRQNIQKEPHGEERINRGFEEIPEVRAVLEAHLDAALDPSLAIRSVYGQWFPWLVLLDEKWASAHVSRILPLEESLRNLRDTAWETYIVFCKPYDNVFDVLRDEYRRAVESIGATRSQRQRPEEHLAEHLLIFYERGKLDLDDPNGLLSLFYEKASAALRGHVLTIEGQRLYRTKGEVPHEILDRLKVLWERRLAVAQANAHPETYAAELSGFGWWFVSAKFDDAWSLDHLIATLKISPRMEMVEHLLYERLTALAAAIPRKTVECLRLVAEGDVEGWRIYTWREHARAILAAAIQSTDTRAQEAAVELIHRLGARGYFEFRDLLPKTPT